MADPSTYRLEALLRLRRQEEEIAQQALAMALRAAEEAEDQVVQAQEMMKRRERELDRAREDALRSGQASELVRRRRFVERKERDLAAASEAMREAKARLEEIVRQVTQERSALAAAVRARETLERHRESWEQQRRDQAERRQDEERDDLVASRSARRRRDDQ